MSVFIQQPDLSIFLLH